MLSWKPITFLKPNLLRMIKHLTCPVSPTFEMLTYKYHHANQIIHQMR